MLPSLDSYGLLPAVDTAPAFLLGASSTTVSLSPWCLVEGRVCTQTSIIYVQDCLHRFRMNYKSSPSWVAPHPFLQLLGVVQLLPHLT